MFQKAKTTNRLTALLLAFVMLLSLIPAMSLTAYAVEQSTPEEVAANIYTPLTVSGFNADIVAESMDNLAATTGVENGHVYIASSFDTSKPSDSAGFFPGGKVITTTTGRKYQLQPTTSNNTLKLTDGGQYGGTEKGSLIVDTNKKYQKIGILTTGGGGDANISVEVEYTDGTKSSPVNIVAYDWYHGPDASKVYFGLWRMNKNATTYNSSSTSGMYEYIIDVDSTKVVKQLNFTYIDGGMAGDIFALSGVISSDNLCVVTFDLNDGNGPTTENILKGDKITRPANDPAKEGYVFDDWYTDDTYAAKFDFENTPINANTTIYAHFIENTTSSPQTGAQQGGTTGGDTSSQQTGNDSGSATSPQTGDNSHMGLWIAIMILSLCALAATLFIGKKKRVFDR